MKIAFILTQSLDSPSGLGRYGPVARELVKIGYQVEILALHHDWTPEIRNPYDDAGVVVKYVGQMHVHKRGSSKQYFSLPKLLYISIHAILRLAHAIYSSDADIIHLGKPQPFNVIAARLGRRGRIIYCDCDDYEAETNNFSHEWQRQIVRYFEDSIIRVASKMTVNTTFTEARYISLGYPSHNIKYVPNGVERARFECTADNLEDLIAKWNLSADDPLIMYVGSLSLISHPVDLLLKAFVHVKQEIPQARLMIIGGGEDFHHLQKESLALDIFSNVTFTGRISPDEIPQYLRLAMLTVDPVLDDLTAKARCPLKVLESIAVGVPVVTGDVGDRRLILHDGQLGILVEPGDSLSLAQGIITLIHDVPTRTSMEERSNTLRHSLFWDQLVFEFAQVYES